MRRRPVKHLRRKICDRLRTHPLEAVLAIVGPTALLVVTARVVGAWVLDVVLVVVAISLARPTLARVGAQARTRGTRCAHTESLIVAWWQIIRCLIGGCWDVFLIWFSDRRRAIARYEQTCRVARLDPVPTVVSWRETLEGDEYVVAVYAGGGVTTAEFTNWEVRLQDAAGVQCRRVRIARMEQGGQCIVTFVYRDPLKLIHLGLPPLAKVNAWDIRKPVSLGSDERGKPVTVAVHNRNSMMIGLPGMGKTTAQTSIVAAAAMAANARLIYIDFKGNIASRVWFDVADRIARTPEEAHAVIDDIEKEMDADLVRVGEADRDELDPTAKWPATVIVIDEVTDLDTWSRGRVRRIAQMGRAACYTVHWATQRSHHQLVDTNLRGVTHWAMSFGVKTSADSDLALGDGMADKGYDASTLETPGEFYYVGPQSNPLRCKAYDFPRGLRHEVAARCAPPEQFAPVFAPPTGTPQYAPSDQETSLEGVEAGTPPNQEPTPAATGPDLTGAPGQAKVYEAIVNAPDGLTFGDIHKAVGGSKETVTKALARLDGRWIRKEIDRYKAIQPATDVAA